MLKAGREEAVDEPADARRRGDPDRHLEHLAAELGGAAELRPAAGQDEPGRQHAVAGLAHPVAHQLERLAHPRLDDLAHLEPADLAPGLLAEGGDGDVLVLVDAPQVARPVA